MPPSPDQPTSVWRTRRGRVALQPASAVPWSRADLLVARAQAERDGGRLAAADALLDEARGIDPLNADVAHVQGLVARQRGDLARASALLESGCALAPRDAGLANDLGLVRMAQLRAHEALVLFDRALALTPRARAPAVNRANALAALHRTEQAIAAYRALLASTRDGREARANLAAVLERAGRLAEAAAAVREGLASAPRDAVLNLTAARLERRAGRLDKALHRLDALAGWRPVATVAAELEFERARLHDARDEPQAAFAALRRGNRLAERLARGTGVATGVLTAAVDAVGPQLRAADPGPGAPDRDAPVFVVGLPGAGIEDLAAALRARTPLPVVEAGDALAAAGAHGPPSPARYLARMAATSGAAPPLIDAEPLNLLRVALIIQLFPGARFIVLERDPADIVLGCYARSYRAGPLGVAFARLQRTLALTARLLEALGEVRRFLGPAALSVRFESLSAGPDAAVEALLKDLALPVRPGRAPAPTVEVLGPGRWRRYWPYLREHEAALAALAAAAGYPFEVPEAPV